MKWLNRLRCELQDHIRVTEDGGDDYLEKLRRSDPLALTPTERAFVRGAEYVLAERREVSYSIPHPVPVTRCTRCGWTSRRMDG